MIASFCDKSTACRCSEQTVRGSGIVTTHSLHLPLAALATCHYDNHNVFTMFLFTTPYKETVNTRTHVSISTIASTVRDLLHARRSRIGIETVPNNSRTCMSVNGALIVSQAKPFSVYFRFALSVKGSGKLPISFWF